MLDFPFTINWLNAQGFPQRSFAIIFKMIVNKYVLSVGQKKKSGLFTQLYLDQLFRWHFLGLLERDSDPAQTEECLCAAATHEL